GVRCWARKSVRFSTPGSPRQRFRPQRIGCSAWLHSVNDVSESTGIVEATLNSKGYQAAKGRLQNIINYALHTEDSLLNLVWYLSKAIVSDPAHRLDDSYQLEACEAVSHLTGRKRSDPWPKWVNKLGESFFNAVKDASQGVFIQSSTGAEQTVKKII